MANIEITDIQKDAIGEIMNVGMGSAATAVSELLDAKVLITTPTVNVEKVKELKREELEPAICVKIVYTKGIDGANLMLLKQDDVQMILNQLMGQPLELQPDFEFDELNISAVSEVMNQMMGSCSTAMSKFLDMNIDISPPEPRVMDSIDFSSVEPEEFAEDEEVVTVNFHLTIEDIIDSEFMTVMRSELVQELSDRLVEINKPPEVEAKPEVAPSVETGGAATTQQPAAGAMPAQGGGYPPPQGMPPGGTPPLGAYPPPQGTMPMGAAPYGYYQQPYGGNSMQQPINIQNAQLHQFENFDINLPSEQKDNLQLLMNVPLQISVEIGKTRRRVKEILEFAQGTIIELERQAGAPVDIVVNGNLIARGDVVVIDDNFAVRITEIIKSKFMDSLGKE
ncbi:MAG: flagellar motor switch phosphatase FliY [Oscillospiraceae bacterium]|nr:flagellar motor switch phosphatase FliY [Oscillospiraceae bacterium]